MEVDKSVIEDFFTHLRAPLKNALLKPKLFSRKVLLEIEYISSHFFIKSKNCFFANPTFSNSSAVSTKSDFTSK